MGAKQNKLRTGDLANKSDESGEMGENTHSIMMLGFVLMTDLKTKTKIPGGHEEQRHEHQAFIPNIPRIQEE